jgi:hypothetical protein
MLSQHSEGGGTKFRVYIVKVLSSQFPFGERCSDSVWFYCGLIYLSKILGAAQQQNGTHFRQTIEIIILYKPKNKSK